MLQNSNHRTGQGLTLAGQTLSWAVSIKYLGVMFSERGTDAALNLQARIKKATTTAGSLVRQGVTRMSMSTAQRVQLFRSYIQTSLDYGLAGIMYNEQQMQRMDEVQMDLLGTILWLSARTKQGGIIKPRAIRPLLHIPYTNQRAQEAGARLWGSLDTTNDTCNKLADVLSQPHWPPSRVCARIPPLKEDVVAARRLRFKQDNERRKWPPPNMGRVADSVSHTTLPSTRWLFKIYQNRAVDSHSNWGHLHALMPTFKRRLFELLHHDFGKCIMDQGSIEAMSQVIRRWFYLRNNHDCVQKVQTWKDIASGSIVAGECI